jgi:hyperosmotically inducible periplasmic protein
MKTNVHFKFAPLIIALAFASASLQAYAFGTAEDVDKTAYSDAFKAMDVNHDGTLDKSEVKKDKLFSRHFSAADKDHDGTLDQEEYSNYRTRAEQKNVKRVASDSLITSKIKGKLLKDEGLKSMHVSVETHQGVVLLSGFVTKEEQIQLAEKIAAETEGVKSVKNSLILKKD